MKLANYVSGEWKHGTGEEHTLLDPVTGEQLATVSSTGIDLAAALDYARTKGTAGLQQLAYAQRADLLGKIADVLSANRDQYFEISLKNLGATQADASFDVDGAIYTLKTYAKLGKPLEGTIVLDGAAIPLSKTGVFQGQHFLKPLSGAAVLINAFNFPAWGLWEKAAPALLSGVAIVVKPATATAWLTQRMVEDVIKAGILPDGALSILCGSARALLNHVSENDVILFTGSAGTAHSIRTNDNVVAKSTRLNVEADSLNATILGHDAPGTQPFDLLVKEVVREMTLKAGQKCTAIRRILAPRETAQSLADAIAAKLATVKVGNPRNSEVKCGPLVNKAQQKVALESLAQLQREAKIVFGGGFDFEPIDADAKVSCFVQPTLLFCNKPMQSKAVNEIEVFGPVATILPYDSDNEAIELARRGGGSLVASIFSDDKEFQRLITIGIAGWHGRIMVVDTQVDGQHTGHGNVMPSCLHGGPGRAGGGEELAGLRALQLYHRRFVVQGPPELMAAIATDSIDASAL
ncbi:MAG TPA: 3,4-dehydroadipyl-CoA semialdehyde dehydrogenase [Terriglobales bacterium]